MGIAIVQSTANSYNATDTTTPKLHFGSAPTNGNLLIVLGSVRDNAGAPSPATGWTKLADGGDSGSTGHYAVIYYKYAGASESATQTIDTGARDQWGLTAYEISGVTGTIGTDVPATHLNSSFLVSSGGATTASFNTPANNELILCGVSSQSSPAQTQLMTPGTTDAQINASTTDAFGSFDSAIGNHLAEATSGTAVSFNWQSSLADAFGCYAIAVLANFSGGSETSTATLALTKVSFNAVADETETATAGLALGKVGFNAQAHRVETATATLALGKVGIAAAVLDLGAAGSGAVHFATFGA